MLPSISIDNGVLLALQFGSICRSFGSAQWNRIIFRHCSLAAFAEEVNVVMTFDRHFGRPESVKLTLERRLEQPCGAKLALELRLEQPFGGKLALERRFVSPWDA